VSLLPGYNSVAVATSNSTVVKHLWHHLKVKGLSSTPTTVTRDLCYKQMTIVNYASSIVNKLEALLTDNARVVIYDCHVFIAQATRAHATYPMQ
jgi:hypothetical protein